MRQTPFETFLDRFDPESRPNQLAFFRILAGAGPGAIEELAGRVQRVSCPAGLRQIALEASYYYPWEAWLPLVDRLLKHEHDPRLFETGARALGRMRTPEAIAALRELSQARATPGFREIVDQVLFESDPAEAFQHHFARLLQGSAQSADANEGAHQLAHLLTPASLEALKAAVNHPDALIHRHALQLVGLISSREAAAFLLEYLKEVHQESLEDREIRALLVACRPLPRPDLQAKAVQALSSLWQEAQPGAMADLAAGPVDRVRAGAAVLRASNPGSLTTFLLDLLLAASDDKPAQLAKFLGQAGDAVHQRTRRSGFALDMAARSLAAMTGQGLLQAELLVPALAESLRQKTGGIGVVSALAQLVPASATDLLDLLVDQTGGNLRSAALETLGERKDPALRAALLKLRRDAIADIADRCLWHLGQLPGRAETARRLLADADPEEAMVGLRFAAMHRLEELLPDLLELVAQSPREAVLISALETLGAIGAPSCFAPLMALLHSGQGPRLQLALGQALRETCDAEGALALCAKAGELHSPGLHALAVEALARVHSDPEHALPGPAQEHLVEAVQGGWSDRNPWPLRCRIAAALLSLHLQEPRGWAKLAELFQATLGEKRASGAVAVEDLAVIQACARTLAQRALG